MAVYAVGFRSPRRAGTRRVRTGRFDLGNMVQAVWSTAHGRPLDVTELDGDQINRLGAHVDPLLAALAPLWWIWPSPKLLLVVQAVVIALGALPVFWLARKHLASGRNGALFALVYLLYAPVQWLALDEFHPVALACPLLLFAIWYLDERRLYAALPFLALAALSKEEVALVVAGLGVWYALARGSAWPGRRSQRRIRAERLLPRGCHASLPRRRRTGVLRPLRRARRLTALCRRRLRSPTRCSSSEP